MIELDHPFDKIPNILDKIKDIEYTTKLYAAFCNNTWDYNKDGVIIEGDMGSFRSNGYDFARLRNIAFGKETGREGELLAGYHMSGPFDTYIDIYWLPNNHGMSWGHVTDDIKKEMEDCGFTLR